MGYIVLGFIFPHAHINIGTFDILPDFLGYILISLGVGSLVFKNEYFKTAEKISMVTGVVRLVFDAVSMLGFGYGNGFGFLFTTVITFVEIYILYNIIQGLLQVEREEQVYINGESLQKPWLILTVLNIVSILLYMGRVSIIYTLVVIMQLIIVVIIIYNLNITRKLYNEII